MNPTPYRLLTEWLRRIRHAQVAHILSTAYFERLNLWVGVPVVLLTALVGTSVFATLQNDTSAWIKVAAGLASVLAAILASLQTFLKFSERAARHSAVAPRYGALRKEIEQQLAFPTHDADQMKEYLDTVRDRWEKLSGEGPSVPQWIWDRTRSEPRARSGEGTSTTQPDTESQSGSVLNGVQTEPPYRL